jgi:uncharacterized protein (TIGR02996 family)
MAPTVADNRRVPPGFRYFELVDELAGRFAFWEIAIDGPTLELRHGAVGTAGKHEKETCSSEELARTEYELRIAARLEDGFREVADRRLDVRTRDLEAAIEADPDDASAYLVYADWIGTLGDPRGGLIVAQAGGDAAAAAAYLKQYEATFLGPLAEHVGYDGAIIDATWRNGFIRHATVRERGERRVDLLLEALLEHPSARWLGALTLQTVDDMADLRSLVRVLASHRLPHLTSLELGEVGELHDPPLMGDDDPHHYGLRHATDLAPIWASVPALRRLVVRGDPKHLGTIELPRLSHLELHVKLLGDRESEAIANLAAPLERLELRFRWPIGAILDSVLAPILRSPMIRGLDHLAITGTRGSQLIGVDGVCASLARRPPRSLRSLDLSHSTLTDDAAAVLAETPLELDVIDVSKTLVTGRGAQVLERIAKLVIR